MLRREERDAGSRGRGAPRVGRDPGHGSAPAALGLASPTSLRREAGLLLSPWRPPQTACVGVAGPAGTARGSPSAREPRGPCGAPATQRRQGVALALALSTACPRHFPPLTPPPPSLHCSGSCLSFPKAPQVPTKRPCTSAVAWYSRGRPALLQSTGKCNRCRKSQRSGRS